MFYVGISNPDPKRYPDLNRPADIERYKFPTLSAAIMFLWGKYGGGLTITQDDNPTGWEGRIGYTYIAILKMGA